MLYSSDSGILMKGQAYRFLVMVILVQVTGDDGISRMSGRANSRMSRKTSPVPSNPENTHIHKLLFKCAKTCSKPGQQDTHFVLPICAAYTNHLINGWSPTFIYTYGQFTNA